MHNHGHGSYSSSPKKEGTKQKWINSFIATISISLIAILCVIALNRTLLVKLLDFNTDGESEITEEFNVEYYIGETMEIIFLEEMGEVDEEETEDLQDEFQYDGMIAEVLVLILTGELQGEEVWVQVSEADRSLVDHEGELVFDEGTELVISKTDFSGVVQFNIVDLFRLPAAILAVVLFLVIAVIFAGIKGLSSFLGLVVSMFILIGFVVPGILAGGNPVLISFIGAVAIAFFSLYLAHGFNKRTTLALGSTLISISLAVVLAVVFVELTRLIGVGSEEAIFVESVSLGAINLKGLLLGGIIIGTLGVLDDITTAQTAVVEEIKNADKKLNLKELYSRANSVGKEHIASLINTLVLAYAGSSFALFILIVANTTDPLWLTLNSAFIVEEIVRTIVGSATLVLAVPISTMVAAYFFTKEKQC